MRTKTVLTIAAGLLALTTLGANAEPRIYPHHGENFCPAGLQPITISGVICCGKPNQTVSYQAMKRTPVRKKKHTHTHTKRYSHTHVKRHTHTKRSTHSHSH